MGEFVDPFVHFLGVLLVLNYSFVLKCYNFSVKSVYSLLQLLQINSVLLRQFTLQIIPLLYFVLLHIDVLPPIKILLDGHHQFLLQRYHLFLPLLELLLLHQTQLRNAGLVLAYNVPHKSVVVYAAIPSLGFVLYSLYLCQILSSLRKLTHLRESNNSMAPQHHPTQTIPLLFLYFIFDGVGQQLLRSLGLFGSDHQIGQIVDGAEIAGLKSQHFLVESSGSVGVVQVIVAESYLTVD